MKRYQNVDKLRGAACLLVLFYHIYAITGKLLIDIPVIKHIHIMGGEIGVTIFFVLSGYGIFFSLNRMDKSGHISFKDFMKKRINRICPQYYLNLLILLLLTSGAVYLSKEHLWNIVLHIFFLHSLTIASHGAINGVLWTMSVMVQFYLFAIPLYKIIKKIDNEVFSLIFFVGLTIAMKYVVLNYLWVESTEKFGSFAIMIPGRQLFTSLDNFVIGMLTAKVTFRKKDSMFSYKNAILILISLVLICFLAVLACNYSIYGRNIWGYTFFSILSMTISLFILGISFDMNDGLISRILLFVSDYEYTIYLWHLPIIRNIIENTNFINVSTTLVHTFNIYMICLFGSLIIGVVLGKSHIRFLNNT